jgi:hypothetical protein
VARQLLDLTLGTPFSEVGGSVDGVRPYALWDGVNFSIITPGPFNLVNASGVTINGLSAGAAILPWTSGTVYVVGQQVLYNQAEWVVTTAHLAGATFAYGNFRLLSSIGDRRFDITAFGADPTGVLDSAPAIQLAINAALATNAGGIVYCPPGNYLLNSLNIGAAMTGANFACFGIDMANMQTTVTTNFTLPGSGNTVTVAVASSAWMQVGMTIQIASGGALTVTTINSPTSVLFTQFGSGSGTVTATTVLQNGSSFAVPSLVGTDWYGSLYPAGGGGQNNEQTYDVQFSVGPALSAANTAWIMYWGGGPQAAAGGFEIGGFLINQGYTSNANGPGGAILLNNCGGYNVRRIFLRGNQVAPVTPTPLSSVSPSVSTASGHVSAIIYSGSTFAWNGQFNSVYSNNSGNDGICLNEGIHARTVVSWCESHNCLRYGFYAGVRVRLDHCYASGATTANFYLDRAWMNDCETEQAGGASGGNEIWINNTGTDGTGSSPQKSIVTGGTYRGTNIAGTEAQTAIIYIQSNKSGVVIANVALLCGSQTSELVYCDNAIQATEPISIVGSLVDLTSSTWLNAAGGTNTCPSGIRIPTGFAQLFAPAAANANFGQALHTSVLELSANAAAPAINTDAYDSVNITAQTAAITGFTMSGNPKDGDKLIISITGTASVALAWGTSFESSGTQTLPTTTSGTNRLDVGFRYNTATSKWRLMGVS